MMADDGDDDYLSDKFLTITEPQKPKTYSEKRKEAVRKSLLKDEQNRTKSAKQLELESREEGLSKSLFERAEHDKSSGRGTENKALSMMMKMGFKPGQALGVPANVDVDEGSTSMGTITPPSRQDPTRSPETLGIQPQIHEGGLVNPLPINEWSGKKGIGLGKRAPSPTELERLAKVAKATEETNKESFRDRTRREYELRRAEARLGPAQRTCVTLDERAGKEFNVLWLDPINPDTFPVGLLDAVTVSTAAAAATATTTPALSGSGKGEERSVEERLREQMRADALQPLDDDDDDVDVLGDVLVSLPKNTDFNGETHLPPKWIEDAAQFLRLNAAERLDRILQYLRAEYHYCFWCGTEYKSSDEMEEECPGTEEDMHD